MIRAGKYTVEDSGFTVTTERIGGLPRQAVVVELPGGIDTSALLQESSTDPAVNVAFVAGEGFFSDRDGQGKNCMRMSFGNTPEDLIEEGVRRLGGLICSKLNK